MSHEQGCKVRRIRHCRAPLERNVDKSKLRPATTKLQKTIHQWGMGRSLL